MKFEEFKKEIEAVYNGKFSNSLCECKIFRCLGRSLTIDCYLAADKRECNNGYFENDIFSVSFMAYMPDDWTEADELPEVVEFKALKSTIKTAPEVEYFYCGYEKIAYRKTKTTPEKFIQTFKKYVDRLHTALLEQYISNNLLADDMERVKNKCL